MNAMGTGAGEPAQYAYVACYAYSDVVVRNDNPLMLSPYTGRYQTPANGDCEVDTIPAGQQITPRRSRRSSRGGPGSDSEQGPPLV